MNAERFARGFELGTNIALYAGASAFRSGMARGIARQQAREEAFNAARAVAIRSATARRRAVFAAGRDAEVARILASL